MKAMIKSKEDILKEYAVETIDEYNSLYERVKKAMDQYARQQAIEFFKWYGVKMAVFVEYIKDVRPLVTSNEIEEKIKEFEGKSFEELYNLFNPISKTIKQ